MVGRQQDWRLAPRRLQVDEGSAGYDYVNEQIVWPRRMLRAQRSLLVGRGLKLFDYPALESRNDLVACYFSVVR